MSIRVKVGEGSIPLALLEGLEERKLFAANALDTSFGGGSGRVLSTLGVDAEFTSVVSLPDGKILAAGTADRGGGKHDFVVARYNASGSADTSFGGGTGRVYTDFSGRDDSAAKLIFLSGGKFLVVGSTRATSDNIESSNFALARYNANGSLDTSFRGTGKGNIDFNGNTDVATDAAVLSSGKLLITGTTTAGEYYSSGGVNFGAIRLDLKGYLDTTFASGGKLSSNFGAFVDDGFGHQYTYGQQVANAVAVLPGDGFVIAGGIDDFYDSGETFSDFAVAKYTINGKLDTSFGGGKGWMQFRPGGNFAFATSIAVLNSGKLLVGGTAQSYYSDFPQESDFAIGRINANGTLDTSFGPAGSNGLVTTHLFESYDEDTGVTTYSDSRLRGLLVQPNGKIVATGSSRLNDSNGGEATLTAVVRYNSTGTLDTSFSGDGKQLYGQLEGAFAIAAAPGGKTLIAGYQGNKAGVLRFQSDSAATASISGVFFNDLDADGKKDTNEKPLAGWIAFVDSNNDGVFTPGEVSAKTDSSGKYKITGLTPGTYRIREVRLDGWNRTKPTGVYPAGFYDVAVGVGQAALGKDFGNKHV